MCGIAGWIGPERPPEAAVRAMTAALAHRGPDGEGLWTGTGATLGHRRLVVIDREGGAQPMTTPDGRYAIAYNGEIYNFRDLRARLERDGARFRTRSDTEVLLAWLVARGAAGVDDLAGPFALALWDSERRTLLLARDRIGKKPLYVLERAGDLLFASEAKALLPHVGAVEADPTALTCALAFGVAPPDRSIFRGIRTVPPGCRATFSPGGPLRIERYWNPMHEPEAAADPEEFLALLRRAVAERLIADVPLAIFLSGGIDSTAAAALAVETAEKRVKTFSAFVEGEPNDPDLEASRRCAAILGTDHTEVHLRVRDRDALESFVEMVRIQENPQQVGGPALLLYALCREVRKIATVALAGDGGDEVLGGYYPYVKVRRLSAVWPASLPGFDPADFIARRYRRGRAPYLGLLRPEVLAAAGDAPERLEVETIRRARPRTLFEAWLWSDLALHNYQVVAFMGDANGMAHGLEIRAPFLDHRLVEWMMRRPDSARVTLGGTTKALARRALRGILPDFVLTRPKVGMSGTTPYRVLASWRPWVERTIRTSEPLRALFDPAAVDRALERARASHNLPAGPAWFLLSYAVWADLYLRGRSPDEIVAEAVEAIRA